MPIGCFESPNQQENIEIHTGTVGCIYVFMRSKRSLQLREREEKKRLQDFVTGYVPSIEAVLFAEHNSLI